MFEKKYKVGDLHVVWLGKAKQANEEITLNSIRKWRYRIVKDYHHSEYREEETCIDVLNNTKYERFSYRSHAEGVYFEYSRPLSAILPTKEKVTKSELISLYHKLNRLDKEETQEQDKEDEKDKVQDDNKDDNKIEDCILKLILTTIDKINALDLFNEKRTEILTSLKTLAEYYVSTLITLKSLGENQTPITELELECKNKIAEIELSLTDVEKTENLKKQLVMVKQRLK